MAQQFDLCLRARIVNCDSQLVTGLDASMVQMQRRDIHPVCVMRYAI
jgi:hypothetical protein